MAVHQKLSEIGWFYHAPEIPNSGLGPMTVPLASQVPGLNDVSLMEPEPARAQVFRDTDTNYIRLAKMGGRGDLLSHKEYDHTGKGGEAKPYPRVDWYYLEDNAVEDADQKEKSKWHFRLPEYMVHDEFKPNGEETEEFRPRRLPYAFDTKSAYDREDRRKAIPEFKKFGYGIRDKKLQVAKKREGYQQAAPHTAPAGPKPNDRFPTLPPLYNAVEKPAMSKIMSYGYQSEWQNVRDDWYAKTRALDGKFTVATDKKKRAGPTTEGHVAAARHVTYKELMGTKAKPQHPSDGDGDKAPFKLSKFKNVNAKVTSHR